MFTLVSGKPAPDEWREINLDYHRDESSCSTEDEDHEPFLKIRAYSMRTLPELLGLRNIISLGPPNEHRYIDKGSDGDCDE